MNVWVHVFKISFERLMVNLLLSSVDGKMHLLPCSSYIILFFVFVFCLAFKFSFPRSVLSLESLMVNLLLSLEDSSIDPFITISVVSIYIHRFHFSYSQLFEFLSSRSVLSLQILMVNMLLSSVGSRTFPSIAISVVYLSIFWFLAFEFVSSRSVLSFESLMVNLLLYLV